MVLGMVGSLATVICAEGIDASIEGGFNDRTRSNNVSNSCRDTDSAVVVDDDGVAIPAVVVSVTVFVDFFDFVAFVERVARGDDIEDEK
jgi:hypothetical protein